MLPVMSLRRVMLEGSEKTRSKGAGTLVAQRIEWSSLRASVRRSWLTTMSRPMLLSGLSSLRATEPKSQIWMGSVGDDVVGQRRYPVGDGSIVRQRPAVLGRRCRGAHGHGVR